MRWVRSTLYDDELASHLDKLSHRASLAGHLLRQALYQRVGDRMPRFTGFNRATPAHHQWR